MSQGRATRYASGKTPRETPYDNDGQDEQDEQDRRKRQRLSSSGQESSQEDMNRLFSSSYVAPRLRKLYPTNAEKRQQRESDRNNTEQQIRDAVAHDQEIKFLTEHSKQVFGHMLLPDESLVDKMTRVFDYNLAGKDLPKIDVHMQVYKVQEEIFTLYAKCAKAKLFDPGHQDFQGDEFVVKWQRAAHIASHICHIMLTSTHIQRAITEPEITVENVDMSASMGVMGFVDPYCTDNLNSMNEHQKLLVYMLNELGKAKLRRQSDKVMTQQITRDGFPTGFWYPWREQRSTIMDFIESHTTRNIHYQQFLWSSQRLGTKEMVAKNLLTCEDMSFPDVVPDRHVFVFRNGIYDCLKQKFYAFGAEAPARETTACNVFDSDVDTSLLETPVINIQDLARTCPHLYSVLAYQGWEEEVKRMFMVMLGRMFYNLKEVDRFQIMPYCIGVAGSGKSTLFKLIRKFYPIHHVGIVSNNTEKQWSLGSIYNKLLFIAPEIKHDFKMDQADLQSIISGEMTSICIKNKMAMQVDWTVPGFMGGNQFPGFFDNLGSIARRFLFFVFERVVQKNDVDCRLDDKLEEELPNIIVLANRLYHQYVNLMGDRDIWTNVPKYFETQRDSILREANPLINFINSGSIYIKGYTTQNAVINQPYMSSKEFRQKFTEFRNSYNLRNYQWVVTDVEILFKNRGIHICKANLPWPPTQQERFEIGEYFIGACFVDHTDCFGIPRTVVTEGME